MPQPIKWPSIIALGDQVGPAIIRHLDLSFRQMVSSNPHAFAERDYMRLITGLDHPYGNFAVLAGNASAEVVKQTVLRLSDRNIASCVILTSPAEPALLDVLLSKGFEKHDPMPAMAVDIDQLPPSHLPEGYSFQRLRLVPSQIAAWTQTFADGFEFPLEVGELYAPAEGAGESPTSEMQYFAIAKEGRFVATSMLHLKEGLAGIYCVATLPSERGKGLGAYATAEPLRRVRELGYGVGILQASEAGQPVYLRLGFKEYGSLPVYVRIPKS